MYDPEATQRAFDEEGFYKTGDIARQECGLYYIEGRSAIDSKLSRSVASKVCFHSVLSSDSCKVIKSGGYKISALDVEAEVASHPKVSEAIVVGIDDEEFGQRIAAAVVLHRVCIHSYLILLTGITC